MTRRRMTAKVALGSFALAAALGCAVADAAAFEREERFEKRVPLEGATRIVIANARGDVRVTGERNRADVQCECVKTVRGRNADESNALFEQMTLEVKRSGSDLVITARYPERGSASRGLIAFLRRQYSTMSIDIDAALPAGMPVEVTTASGDVELGDMLAAVTITTASGDVAAAGVGGDLAVTVSSGDITVERAEGTASLSTASGDISAFRIGKGLVAQTASGDIEAGEIEGDLTASSASGDVSVEGVGGVAYNGTSGEAVFRGVRGGVSVSLATGDVTVEAAPAAAAGFEIRTSSGTISLSFLKPVPGGFAFKAETTSGDMEVNLPIKVHSVGRHKLEGVVGAGKSVVRLETASGDISVIEAEE